MTPSHIWYEAAGCPVQPNPVDRRENDCCASCGGAMSCGVASAHFVGPAFSSHADFLRGYSTHVCLPCAWMYAFPKITHRNLIAVPGRIWWPMIGYDSATMERPQWLTVLREIADLPLDTPVAGVLTSDPKPRLWPRAELCTVGAFGLYVHCPDYDLSKFSRFDLAACIVAAETISRALAAGWSKRLVWSGLFADYRRAGKDPVGTAKLETIFQKLRPLPEFLPALLIAGNPKNG